MRNKLFAALSLGFLATLNPQLSTLHAQGTAFTYQGRLNDGANPANGVYNLRFALFDALAVGNQVGSPLTNSPVNVSNGLFTVTLDFGANFPGADRWLEIGVRTNGNGALATLTPRQKITATPYAITAGNLNGALPSANLSGTYANAVNLNNSANSFSGNGSNLTALNASQLTSGTVPAAALNNAWKTGGNAGTTPGVQYLGTPDNLPVEFKVNGARALRLEPNPNAPNLIGGSAANEVTNGIYGAVIAGGGSAAYPNRVGAIYASVLGGAGNTASGNYAAAMGDHTTASGYASTTLGYYTVAAGFASQAGGTAARANHDGAFVWADNTFADFTSTGANQFLIRAAGGVGINNNNPNGAALAVNGNVTVNNTLGTPGNQALELKVNNQRGLRLEPTGSNDTVNVIGGSARNFVAAGVIGATIGGGGSGLDSLYYGVFAFTNQVESDFGTVSGGGNNTIQTDGQFATIGGGVQNTIQFGGGYATIGGGGQNTIGNALYATIGGGYLNNIQYASQFATIGGGLGNTIQPWATFATIAGGQANTIQNNVEMGTIGGGQGNTIQSTAIVATIGGGGQNTVQPNAWWATIAGGKENTIQPNANYAMIAGGLANSATNYAFAAGRRSKANHTGAFVWADSTDADFASSANNQFNIRAGGGVVLSDSTPSLSFGTTVRQMLNLWGTEYGIGVQTSTVYFRTHNAAGAENGFAWYKGGTHNGAAQNAGGGITMMKLDGGGLTVNGTFVSASDRNAKENFTPVDSRAVLDKVAALPLSEWNYKTDNASRHLGPMAQDFYAAFGVGPDDKHIATVDESGVALAAIQGLNQKLDEKDARINELEKRLVSLETLLKSQIRKETHP